MGSHVQALGRGVSLQVTQLTHGVDVLISDAAGVAWSNADVLTDVEYEALVRRYPQQGIYWADWFPDGDYAVTVAMFADVTDLNAAIAVLDR